MERLHYLDFDIKITPEGGKYRAFVLRSPAGEASAVFSLPFSQDRMELLINRLGGSLRRGVRRIDSPEMKTARELGGKLFETVFSGDVYACFKESLDAAAEQKSTGLRIRLRLQETPELADLPWEFLYVPSRDVFLAQSPKTPIVRYLEMPEAIEPLAVDLPLRVLVMISSPADFACLDVAREKANILEALDPLVREGKVLIRFLEDAGLATLRRVLRNESYHVFHFIGHGGFSEQIDEGVLVLEDEEGRSYQANAHRISTALQGGDFPPRLIVLNACEGARAGKSDPYASVAATLVRHGIPAVVAMQFAITDEAAAIFASEFYSALAEGLPVDTALAEARNVIYLKPNDVEWGTPVLYMRSADGTLFSLTGKPAPEPPAADGGRTQEKPAWLDFPAPLPLPGTPAEDRAQTAPPQAAVPAPSHRLRNTLFIVCAVAAALILLYIHLTPERPTITPRPFPRPQAEETDAVGRIRNLAEQGDADAQLRLGTLYARGETVAKNDREALKWFMRSARQSNSQAQYQVGLMYAAGRGVAQNDAEAVRWFRRAATQGYLPAQQALQRRGLTW
ncbi:MAG: CHAT domain-containing protein [Syntrophaceae bacterium]|nr:CHAT domain-containing protein [Syntrophaceae bacterium]